MNSTLYHRLPQLILCLLFSSALFAQKGVIIGGVDLEPSAILEMESDSQGMLVPRMNTLQRDNNVLSPTSGLMIYNEDNGFFNVYRNFWGELDTDWNRILDGATNAPTNDIYRYGNVGIGTDEPEYSLQIGEFNFISPDAYIALKTTSGSQYKAGIKLKHFTENRGFTLVSDDTDNQFKVLAHDNNAAGVPSLRILRSGNAGIREAFSITDFNIRGKTGNTYGLVVEDSDGNNDFIVRSDGGIGVGGTSYSNVDFNIRRKAGNNLSFNIEDANQNKHFAVSSNGHVGIGQMYTNIRFNIQASSFDDSYLSITNPLGSNVFAIDNDDDLVLHLGNAYKPGGSTWAVWSDKRLKNNISNYTEGLEFIKKIRPVWYTYNGKGGTPKGKSFVGVIAQELQEIAPHMVHKMQKSEHETEYLSINNGAMTYMLINAVQEQQDQIESLQTKYDELLQRLESLEKK